MKAFGSVTIFVTMACNLRCPLCTSRALAKRRGPYEMPLGEVERLASTFRASGYAFEQAKISVREPLLWPHLREACKLLRESGVFKHVLVFTNAWAFKPGHEDAVAAALEFADRIAVSRYRGGGEHVAAFVKRFRRAKVQEVPWHYRAPRKPVPRSVPARCACHGFGFLDGVVSVCAGLHPLYATLGREPEDYPQYFVPLERGCLGRFAGLDPARQAHCAFCLGNHNVRGHAQRDPTGIHEPGAVQ